MCVCVCVRAESIKCVVMFMLNHSESAENIAPIMKIKTLPLVQTEMVPSAEPVVPRLD